MYMHFLATAIPHACGVLRTAAFGEQDSVGRSCRRRLPPLEIDTAAIEQTLGPKALRMAASSIQHRRAETITDAHADSIAMGSA